MGCGKKGPPIAYDVTVPRPISDLGGVVREAKVFLRWSMPGNGPDESGMAELREFQVLRQETPLEGEWCDECPERLRVLDVLKKEDLRLVGGRVVYQDRRVTYGHGYVYRVISVSTRGYESRLSNRAVVYWDIPPDPPARVEGTPEDRAANLRWSVVDGAEGYRVYRRGEESEFGDIPLVGVGPDVFSYRDTDLSNEMTFFYTVRSIRKVGETWVEGPGSEEISLIPRDLTPPAPPQGLVAIPIALGIELSWQRNIEPDLLGYFVYRRDRKGGEARRLNEAPLETPIYLDETAILGDAYEYAVTAVDRSLRRNESVLSESVTLRYVR